MRADFELDSDGSVFPTRGGARPNSGPKPQGYEKPEVAQSFDKAKARKEIALADKHELEYKIKSGQYVAREAVQAASATLLSDLVQSMRSIPDNLERKFHLPPDVAEDIERVINAALADVAEGLAMFTTEQLG